MTSNNVPAAEFHHVRKVFNAGHGNAFTALHDVSLRIAENEFFTFLGPSGCGKTTLLRILAGFEQPTSGDVKLFDKDIAHLPANKRPVNTVFQHYALFPHLTVRENVGFALKMMGRPASEITRTSNEMLELVHMEDFANRKPEQLSGGQRQRVALARALAPHPKLLLLDEPLSALDLKLRQAMRIELKMLQRETGITFVFVTHDQEEALAMSDRIAVLSQGNVQQVGTPAAIYEHPANRFVADFIGQSNLLNVTVKTAGKTNVRFRHHGYEKAMETTDAVKAAGACIGMELGVLDDQGNVVGGYVAEYVGIYPDNPGVDTAQGYANTALNQSLDHIISLRGFKSSGKRHIVDMSYVDLDAGDNKNGSVISGLGFLNFAKAPAYPQK